MERKVLILGGGIAGMECAARLRELGWTPIIVEKSSSLGGHVAQWNRLFPDFAPAGSLVDDLLKSVEGIEIYLDSEISLFNYQRKRYNVVLKNGTILHCDAVVLATGFSLFPAEKKEEYGYGIYDHVITNKDLEHWFNTGSDARVPQEPKAIGFVHCVGSRDIKAGNTQCSKVCCITAIKQAIEMKEKFPKAEVYCFYMDLRLFGRKYEDFYIRAQRDMGIHFIRGRVSEVSETIDGRVFVKAEDTLSGKPLRVSLDLLVLMAGIVCNRGNDALAQDAQIALDEDGFFRSRDNVSGVSESERPGMFFAGTCTGPKTIPETLAEARSAAILVDVYLKGLK